MGKPSPPFSERFRALCYHPQFLWWVGHLIVVFCSIHHFLKLFFFDEDKRYFMYRGAHTGVVLSYTVLLYKQYGGLQFSDCLRNLFSDENAFYLILSLMWWWNNPVAVALVPYATFSLFHMLTYFRGNVIPTLVPTIPPNVNAFPSSQPTYVAQLLADTSKFIMHWVQASYHHAMGFVSFVEVIVISIVLFFYVLIDYEPFYTLIVYAMFLRIRFHMSGYTKRVVYKIAEQVRGYLSPNSANPSPSSAASGSSSSSQYGRSSPPRPGRSANRSPSPLAGSSGGPSARPAPSSSLLSVPSGSAAEV